MSEKIDFDYEIMLQHLTNNRLKILFDLEYIAYEYTFPALTVDGLTSGQKTKYLQVDGLAFDDETDSFVVLEYKNKGDQNVLNQGGDYYYNLLQTDENKLINWIKDNLQEEENKRKESEKDDDFDFSKAYDFLDENKEYYHEMLQENRRKLIKRYNKEFKENRVEDDFDFSKVKVMIIGPKFFKSQIEKSKNLEYHPELYKVSLNRRDEIRGYVSYEGINVDFKEWINVNLGNLKYTRYTLLYNKSDEMRELYKNLESSLLNRYNDLDVIYYYDIVSIKVHKKKICLVKFGKSIKIEFYDGKIMQLEQDNLNEVLDKFDEIYNGE